MEEQIEPYNIPSDRLYGVVELVIDKLNEEEETDVETYVTPAASNWLRDVKRVESEDGQTRYFAETCFWPRNESKLSTYLERRSKPSDDWVAHTHVRVLKFCRSIGHAKEQTKLALENTTLLDSDVGLGKRVSLPPFRFGFSNIKDHKPTSGSDTDDEPAPIRSLGLYKAALTTKSKKRLRHSNSAESDNDLVNGPRKTSKKGRGALSSSDSDTATDKIGNKSSTNEDASKATGSNDLSSNTNGKEGMMSENSGSKDNANSSQQLKKDDFLNINNHAENSGDQGNDVDKSSSTGKQQNLSENKLKGKGDDLNSTENVLNGHKFSSPNSSTPRKKKDTNPFLRRPASFSPNKVKLVGSSHLSHLTFIREMKDLNKSLNSMKLTLNKVYNCVCPVVEKVTDNDDDRGMPALPVNSFKDMEIWETFLKDHDNTLNVVRLLSERCVLSTLKDSVYNMMKFVLSNKLASSFNVKGKNKAKAAFQKIGFDGSRSCVAINAALKHYQEQMKKAGNTLSYSTGPVEVNNAIGLWLKDAPKRYLNELKHSKTVQSEVTSVPEEYLLPVPAGLSFDVRD